MYKFGKVFLTLRKQDQITVKIVDVSHWVSDIRCFELMKSKIEILTRCLYCIVFS